MSRSYKKNPVIKYGVQVTKPQASRKERRINRMRLHTDDEDYESKLPHEVVNQYDIKDIKFTNFPGDPWHSEEYDYIKRK